MNGFKTGSWCIAEYYSPKCDDYVWHNKIIQIQNFDSFILKLQDTETESLKTHYIHVYKVFG